METFFSSLVRPFFYEQWERRTVEVCYLNHTGICANFEAVILKCRKKKRKNEKY